MFKKKVLLTNNFYYYLIARCKNVLKYFLNFKQVPRTSIIRSLPPFYRSSFNPFVAIKWVDDAKFISSKKNVHRVMNHQEFYKVISWLRKNKIKNIRLLYTFDFLSLDNPIKYVKILEDLGVKYSFHSRFIQSTKIVQEFLNSVNLGYISLFYITVENFENYTVEEYENFKKNINLTSRTGKSIYLVISITRSINLDLLFNIIRGKNVTIYITSSSFDSKKEALRVFCEKDYVKKDFTKSFLNLMPKIAELIDWCENFKVPLIFHKPVPIFCLRNNERFKKYKKYWKYFGTVCVEDKKINPIFIEPDQKARVCAGVLKKSQYKIYDYSSISLLYQELIVEFKSRQWNTFLFKECKKCIYRKKRLCQGTCLAYKCKEPISLRKYLNGVDDSK
ncbi:hypothetical protein HN415_07415 [Candidatus Woesearchaeota archaeon]|jgi:hypothetical protein|nr:hypothetical protein [Candidatus Woesearchaeota archaeon]